MLKLSLFDCKEALSYLHQSIEKFDTLRGFLKDGDQFKVSLLETHGTFSYKLLSYLLSSSGKPQYAFYVEELKRARGLADLMAARYSLEQQISGNPHSWFGIENIITKGTDCTCLYISVGKDDVRFWVQKATGVVCFSEEKVSLDKNERTALVPDSDEFLRESFCNPVKDIIGTSLHLCYKIIIAPVIHLLNEREIIIVPDPSMYQVLFATLTEQESKWLSETKMIPVVPSLTTLKLDVRK